MTSSTETGIVYDRGKCTPDYLWSMNTNCMFNWLARCPLEVKSVTPFVIIYNRDYFNLRIVFFIRPIFYSEYRITSLLCPLKCHPTFVPVLICIKACSSHLKEMTSSWLAKVMTLLLSSFGTGNKYFKMFKTCIESEINRKKGYISSRHTGKASTSMPLYEKICQSV